MHHGKLGGSAGADCRGWVTCVNMYGLTYNRAIASCVEQSSILRCLFACVVSHTVTWALMQSVSEQVKLGSSAKCTDTIGSRGV